VVRVEWVERDPMLQATFRRKNYHLPLTREIEGRLDTRRQAIDGSKMSTI
jgi:hypothetical protein